MRFYVFVLASALLASCTESSSLSPTAMPGTRDAVVRGNNAAPVYSYVYGFKGGPNDGKWPVGPIVSMNGVIYGVTLHAGTNGRGTVFAFDPTHGERIVYAFTGYPNADQPNSITTLNGALYGTSIGGGKYRHGTVFTISASGSERIVHSFGAVGDGIWPSSLTPLHGNLYGVTATGGAQNDGTVFEITASGSEHVLYSFSGGSNGSEPSAPLLAHDGRLYGVTAQGGTTTACYRVGCGTIFSITPAGKISTIYAFAGKPDVQYPSGSLVLIHSTIYGSSSYGGANGQGTIFAVTLPGEERIVASFPTDSAGTGANGVFTDGTHLFGTTGFGPPGTGSVFEVAKTGSLNVIHTFGDAHHDGGVPIGYFAPLGNVWYGVTFYGGPKNRGTIFSVTP